MSTDIILANISLKNLEQVIQRIIPLLQQYKIIALEGDLGAGKTTLVSHLVAALGSRDATSSPTFAYVNRYALPYGSLYHFDLYRFKTAEDWYSQGFEDLLQEPGAIACIEWPQIIEPLLQQPVLRITITTPQPNVRNFHLQTSS